MYTSLAFDTSLSAASVALSHAGRMFYAEDATPGSQATRLIPMIESLLAEAQITYAEIQRLIVTTGPGSFTGLRIGLAAAHGLLAVYPMQTVALSSLEAIARTAARAKPEGHYWATLNAGKGEIAAQLFSMSKESVIPLSEILRLTPEALTTHVKPGEQVIADLLPDARAFVDANLPACGPDALMPYYIRDADAKPNLLG